MIGPSAWQHEPCPSLRSVPGGMESAKGIGTMLLCKKYFVGMHGCAKMLDDIRLKKDIGFMVFLAFIFPSEIEERSSFQFVYLTHTKF